MFINFKDKAWSQYLEYQTKDRKTLKKINELIKSISRNGYSCIGKPEPLINDLSGYYSVRINSKDRLVFKIINDQIIIYQCGEHYQD